MAEQNDGDKTEKPTDKKLQDARKKGDVPKSKEITTTMTLLVWLGLGLVLLPLAAQRIGALMIQVVGSLQQPFSYAAPAMGWMAMEVVLWATAMMLVPVIFVGLLTEFLQTGPVLTFEKVKLKFENLNPVDGVKKMFSINNLIEVLKAVIKTIVLFAVGWAVMKSLLPQIAQLSGAPVAAMGETMWQVAFKLLAWTLAAFAMVSALDMAWQHHSFTKKMMMSLHDIKQEMKESEGDPHVKGHRKQLAHELSQRGSANTAAQANVLVVNPTHVAIAIDYDRETCPVPTLSAKGEDDTALMMREAAEAAGVPIVRNIPLARDMLTRVEVGEIIPQDLFEVMAEVILWAREVREEMQAHQDPLNSDTSAAGSAKKRRPVPGEDMTRYPEGFQRRDH